MQLLVLGATVAETTACISDHKTPKGWKRVSIGHANFNVPKEWQKVDIPEMQLLQGGIMQCRISLNFTMMI